MDALRRPQRDIDPPSCTPAQRIAHARIRCHLAQSLRQIFIGLASICYVRQGSKRITWGKRDTLYGPEQLVLIAPGSQINVGNLPKGGQYLADIVSLPPAVIDAFRRHYPGRNTLAPAPLPVMAIPSHPDIMRAWRYLQESLDDNAAADLQAQGAEALLLALSLHGPIGSLLQDRSDPLGTRIEQQLQMLAPERRNLENVANAFHCSVSTLRRRLVREETSFRRLLDNVQLGQALEQLQTSSLTIAEIASCCGYESASRFAIRFRQHYGMSPSELRHTCRPLPGQPLPEEP